MSGPTAGVVIVAFGEEPLLSEAVSSVLTSTGVEVSVAVVDNGSRQVQQLPVDSRLVVVRPGHNTGFAAGCNLGAAATRGDNLVFLNSDAVVERDAIAALVRSLATPGTGVVSGKVVLYDDPSVVNSAGNPVHLSLLSWAGGWGDPSERHDRPTQVASISGALFAIRRGDYIALGGLSEMLFAYGEDVELSLRTRMAGLSTRFEPDAVARHRYRFTLTAQKRYLLERNRLINVLTLFERRTLVWLGPELLVVEAGVAYAALRQGWLRQKAAGWRWLLTHRGEVRRRRALVQHTRRVGDAAIVPVLTDSLQPPAEAGVRVPAALDAVLRGYGGFVRRRLTAPSS